MKILIVHNAYVFRGGEDVCVENEISALRAAGYEIETFVLKNEPGWSTAWRSVLAPFGHGDEAALETYIQKNCPDIVHAHNLIPRLSPRVFPAAQRAGAATVLTLHNYRPLCLNGLFLTPQGERCERCPSTGSYAPGIQRGCYRNSRPQSFALASHLRIAQKKGWYDGVNRFIAPSQFLKNRLLHYKWQNSDRIDVQGHFLKDMPEAAPLPAESYVLYLGRLSEEKGVLWLLDAFTKVSHNLKLVIAGDGPLRAQVMAVQNPHIEYRGYLTGNEKIKCIARATAVILPSRCYENFPLAVMEANAFGVPVLVSHLGGMSELVETGANGLAFAADDMDSFATMLQIMNQDWRTSEKRKITQCHARDKFSQSTFLTHRRALYSTLLR